MKERVTQVLKTLKNRYHSTLKAQITMYFLVVTILVVVVMDSFFYFQSLWVIQTDLEDYTQQIVDQLSRNIEFYTDYMKDITSILEKNSDVLAELRKDEKSSRHVALKDLTAIRESRRDIASIFIFGENGSVIKENSQIRIKDNVDYKNEKWYRYAVAEKGKPWLSASHVQNIVDLRYPWVVTMSRAVYDPSDGKLLGVIVTDVNFNAITRICNAVKLGERGYVFIVNNKSEYIYHPDQQLIYSGLRAENLKRITEAEPGSWAEYEDHSGKRQLTMSKVGVTGWRVVAVSYLDDLLINRGLVLKTVLLFSVVSVLLAILLSLRLAKSVASPIGKMERHMDDIIQNGLSEHVVIEGSAEIKSLSKSFNTMIIEIKRLLNQVEEDQKMIRMNELKTLQAQINPHFLYNTLDTIIWEAEDENHENVVEMTSALARFFRLGLNQGRSVISLYEEIEHVRNYLIIQKLRYGESLNYDIQVSDEILSCQCAKLILQPLVENAIYHGIRNIDQDGCIHISGKRQGEDILLEVRDNGKGMTQEVLHSLLTPGFESKKENGGVALRNVHQRLRLRYGNAYGLSFKSQVDVGTSVFVKIPFTVMGGEQNE